MVKAALAPNSRFRLPNGAMLDQLAAKLSKIRIFAMQSESGPDGLTAELMDTTLTKTATILTAAIGPRRASIVAVMESHRRDSLAKSTTPGGSEWDALFRKAFEAEIKRCERAIADLDMLSAALDAASPHFQALPPWPYLRDGWHRIAPETERVFRKAMKDANPDIKLGLTGNGPVAAFVAAVVARVCGKAVPSDTIAQYLKRLPGRRGPCRGSCTITECDEHCTRASCIAFRAAHEDRANGIQNSPWFFRTVRDLT